MAELTLTVSNRAITFPQNVPQQITNTEYIDKVKFNCDAEYTGYSLVALFKNGERGKVYPVAVPADRSAVDIDPRALRRRGYLYIGMYGLNGLKVLPTLWSTPIEIKEGVDTSATEDPEAPVPSIYAALVARVGALETAVDDLEDDVDALDVAVDELDEAVDQLDADVDALETTVAGKQDVINDLSVIRNGAALGATALQSVPIATSDTIGGAKFQTHYGLAINTTTGAAYVYPATGSNITSRNNNNRPITPSNMDTAFRTCITAPAQELTDEQKAAACATIGAERSRQWAKIDEHTFETQTNDPYVIETNGQYKTFVYALKCTNGNSGSIYNNMYAVFDDNEQIVCETSTNASGASYVYGIIDFENISIFTGIRATNLVNTMNLYGTAYASQITMFDELMRGGYISNVYLSGTKPAGMELIVFAR